MSIGVALTQLVFDVASQALLKLDPRVYNENLYLKMPIQRALKRDFHADPIKIGANDKCVWVPVNATELNHILFKLTNYSARKESVAADFMYTLKLHAKPERRADYAVGFLIRDKNKNVTLSTEEFTPFFITTAVYINPRIRDQESIDTIENALKSWVGDASGHLMKILASILITDRPLGKMVLLLGSGANGKSVLLGMLERIFGYYASKVSRQDIENLEKTVATLSNSIVNVVSDGGRTSIRESGNEKILIDGESLGIRMLYKNDPTMIKTNALFIEALNEEPATYDKSEGIARRIIRFRFPNYFTPDQKFRDMMWSDKIICHFFSMLVDISGVLTGDKMDMDAAAVDDPLNLKESAEYYYRTNNVIEFLVDQRIDELEKLLKSTRSPGTYNMTELLRDYTQWALYKSNGTNVTERALRNNFFSLFTTERVSVRDPKDKTVKKARMLIAVPITYRNALQYLLDEHKKGIDA